MVEEQVLSRLREKARQIRIHALQMITAAGSGHPGGSLSAADVLAALYFYKLRHDPANPRWPERDRFHLSKGHGAAALYAALALAGYFPVEDLRTFRDIDSYLQGHVDMNWVPGVEMSAGSLGQGLSVGQGMALAARLDGKDYHTFVMLGDGELDEGQVWEATLTIAHRGLDNLTAIVDRNGYQQTDQTENIARLEPLADKWRAFGWLVTEIDGHDMGQIVAALDDATVRRGRPVVIIARTRKGKGVSFVEGVAGFHGKALTYDELARALDELGAEEELRWLQR